MAKNNEIQQNKDNMLSMIAITEDITRTTTRLHQVLYNLMSNPGNIEDIKTSIDDLSNKIKTLKEVTIGTPLVEEDNVIVPGPDDVSPEVDANYMSPLTDDLATLKPVMTKTPELVEEEETPKPPRRKLSTKRPNKPPRGQKGVSTKTPRKPYTKRERPLPNTTD